MDRPKPESEIPFTRWQNVSCGHDPAAPAAAKGSQSCPHEPAKGSRLTTRHDLCGRYIFGRSLLTAYV